MLGRVIATAVVVTIAVAFILPVITVAVRALVMPVTIGVCLYVVVRLVHAWLNRW